MAGVAGARFQTGGDFLVARQVMQAQRRAGVSFDEAFAMALRMVSREDRSVLEATKGAWHCAYDRQPFHSGASFGQLADITDGDIETRRTQLVV
jgi:hypothetical protein